MTAPVEVIKLVERFGRNLDAYKRDGYKEARVRVEFIDPFFEALGWDVRNVGGYAEQYKDVVHEAAMSIGGKARAPDYSFRIGGEPKFFLEAKKPSVGLKGDIGPSFQLRRYSFSAHLPLGILTDFEEFAVYDCRGRPKLGDKASVARVLYLTHDEYVDHWDEIFDIFAKESVLKGSFDRYAQEAKRKRGTGDVDAEFLKEIEGWREVLARNIALRNPKISVHELNFTVQRTIDRIIFLRISEDRGIEDYGRLLALTNGPHIYQRMHDLYRQADEKYNAGLFDFQADTLTKSLTIDDKVLKPVLVNLYYPQSPYEFSVFPADILGQVYEQFLGKVIRLTPGHRAKVEEKPEVKKAGGVYYTPTYIVDYIVKQTVGKLVKGKTPRQISKLHILDPACGSGSFLLGAYQYLLDHHLQYYETHEPKRHARKKQPPIYQGQNGGWRLTTAEKKRVLLNNLYGVDIDRQAVEVTKLSLLLKVLEGETEETLGQQLMMWRERALPDLGDNIKCGNSLIGPDYFEDQLLPDDEEIRCINPFDWEAEFPEIMTAGGFDAVIGNPPWVFTRDVSFGKPAKEYFANGYVGARGKVNLYALFIYRGITLLKRAGWFSMILPNTFLRATTYKQLREHIIRDHRLAQITDTGPGVFKGITASTIIVLARRAQQTSKVTVTELDESGSEVKVNVIDRKHLLANPGIVIDLYADEDARVLIDRVRSQCCPLSTYITHLISGIQTWKQHKSKFISDKPLNQAYKPLLEGKDISRYRLSFNQKYIWYSKDVLNVMQDETIFLLPEKILIQRISGGNRPLKATLDREKYYCFNSINTLVCHDLDNRYVLGILNSTFMSWFYSVTFSNRSMLTVNIANKNLRQLPIRTIDFDDPKDAARHDKMVTLVERMLELHKKLAAAEIPDDKDLYQRQIEATDSQIDALVYELYGLTEEEIAIVEGA